MPSSFKQDKYKLLVEAANDIIYEADAQGKFTYLNPKVREVLGYSDKEFLGKSFLSFIRDDWKEKALEFYQAQIRDSVASTYFEFPCKTKAGSEIWLGQNVQLIQNEVIVEGFVAVARDITERHKSQVLLKQSEEKYRGIIENLQFGLMEVDLEEKVVYANQPMCDLTGYSQEELIGNIASDLLIDTNTRKVIDEEHHKRNKGAATVYEVCLRHKSGSQRWALISRAPVYDAKGAIKGSIGIHMDITERKSAENELENTRTRLKKYKDGLEALNAVTSNPRFSHEDQILGGLRIAKRYLGMELAIISTIEGDRYTVKHFVSRNDVSNLNTGDEFKLGDTFCEVVIDESKLLYINNIGESDYSTHPCYGLFNIESYIGVHYEVNGQIRGTVNFTSANIRERDYDDYDLEFINLFAKWVGYIISLNENNTKLESDKKYLSAINGFVTNLLEDESIEEIAWEIAENVIEEFGFEDCVIYLCDHEQRVCNQIAAYGPKMDKDRKILNPLVIPFGQGIVGSVAQTGKSELISDTRLDERYIKDDQKRLSELAVPIEADGQVIGVIDSENAVADYFTKQHFDTITTIANLAANRLKNAIAKKKQLEAEEYLKDSEKKLRSILDSAIDGVISIDERGLVLEWNKSAENIFGYKGKEAIGKPLTDTIIPEAYKLAHENGMSHYHKTGEGPVLFQKIEISAMRKSGEEFPIELAIIPVKSKGKTTFTAFVSDITVQKNVQEEMEKALQKERELNELKSRFVNLTSHEFRTPLTTIRQNIDLVSFKFQNSYPDAEPILDKYLSRIDGEISRLTGLMNDLLLFGRIESGKIDLDKIPLDSEKVFRSIAEKISLLQQDRSFDFKVTGVPHEINADPKLLDHILTNLITNAYKYSQGRQNPEFTLNFNEIGKVKFHVKDHGIGIPKKDLKQLYQSFYRATNVQNIQGSGLGLSIAKEFTEMHGGQIHVNTKQNVGTEFIVELPQK